MRFDVLTLFPDLFQGYLSQSLLKLAIQTEKVSINLWNIRDWAKGKHSKVDDRPFGGGPGMVMMPEPIFDCVEEVRSKVVDDPGLLSQQTHDNLHEKLLCLPRAHCRSQFCRRAANRPHDMLGKLGPDCADLGHVYGVTLIVYIPSSQPLQHRQRTMR